MRKTNVGGDARLFLKQSLDHFPYLWFCYVILSHYCQSLPTPGSRVLKHKTFYHVQFVTRTMLCVTELYNLFYPEGKKIVPNDIYELLTIEGLAHLIMGDGSKNYGGLRLNMQGFTVADNIKLMNVLTIKFGCICTLHKSRDR